jgi:hypothetical protein
MGESTALNMYLVTRGTSWSFIHCAPGINPAPVCRRPAGLKRGGPAVGAAGTVNPKSFISKTASYFSAVNLGLKKRTAKKEGAVHSGFKRFFIENLASCVR